MDMNPYGRVSTPNEETCGCAIANPADFRRPTAPVGDERLRDGKGKYCGIVTLRWSPGKGGSWPIVADQEPRVSGFSVSGERQLLAELRPSYSGARHKLNVSLKNG